MTDTPEPSELTLSELGPLSWCAGAILTAAGKISAMRLARRWVPLLKPRNQITDDERQSPEWTLKRAAAVEYYLVGWLLVVAVITVTVLVIPQPCLLFRVAAYLIVAWRTIEIVQTTVAVAVTDRLTGRADDVVASSARLLVLAFVNFLELITCFGVVYALDLGRLKGAGQAATAFYFSAITQITIGYGDVHPTGYLRVVAAAQGVVSLVFLALVFARFLTSLRPINTFKRPAKAGGE